MSSRLGQIGGFWRAVPGTLGLSPRGSEVGSMGTVLGVFSSSCP